MALFYVMFFSILQCLCNHLCHTTVVFANNIITVRVTEKSFTSHSTYSHFRDDYFQPNQI